jgi:hypothetical protein
MFEGGNRRDGEIVSRLVLEMGHRWRSLNGRRLVRFWFARKSGFQGPLLLPRFASSICFVNHDVTFNSENISSSVLKIVRFVAIKIHVVVVILRQKISWVLSRIIGH